MIFCDDLLKGWQGDPEDHDDNILKVKLITVRVNTTVCATIEWHLQIGQQR